MKRIILVCICCIAAIAMFVTGACAVTYQIRQLSVGTAGVSATSWATSINNSGFVAGAVYDDDVCHAAVGNAHGQLMLMDEGFALGINASGCTVGNAGGAALWNSSGSMSHLALPDGATFSQAFDINDAGQIVGECWLGTSQIGNYITIWSGDEAPIVLGLGCASAINSAGSVVGFKKGSGGKREAFVWNSNDGLITLAGGLSSEANAINDLGVVAGTVSDEAGMWACTWSASGNMTRLANLSGALSSTAYGINNLGLVVGCCETATGTVGVLWQADGALVSLDWLGGDSGCMAYAINDLGQIAGCSLDSSYNPRAVIWESVPEPGGLFAMMTGIAALIARFKRRG